MISCDSELVVGIEARWLFLGLGTTVDGCVEYIRLGHIFVLGTFPLSSTLCPAFCFVTLSLFLLSPRHPTLDITDQ